MTTLFDRVRALVETYAGTPHAISFDVALDAANAGRLWEVFTGNTSCPIGGKTESEALHLAASALGCDDGGFDPVAAGWTAFRVVASTGPVITIEQYDRAWELAGAYGHRWANDRDAPSVEAYADSVRYEGTGIDVSVIESASGRDARLAGDSFGGIWAPEVASAHVLGYRDLGDVPVVVHATGTRRLRWHILPDGEVRLYVSRLGPDGNGYVVASARVPANRSLSVETMAVTRASEESGQGARARHLMALHEALKALRGPREAWASVLDHAEACGVRLILTQEETSLHWGLADLETETEDYPLHVFPASTRSLEEAFALLRVGA